jgi:hypothetical protein
MPAPSPSRIMLGSTSTANVPSTGARAKSASPADAKSRPVASGFLLPKRMTSLADKPSDSTAMMTLAGTKARPTCSGP